MNKALAWFITYVPQKSFFEFLECNNQSLIQDLLQLTYSRPLEKFFSEREKRSVKEREKLKKFSLFNLNSFKKSSHNSLLNGPAMRKISKCSCLYS